MINRIKNWKMKVWKQKKTEKDGRPIVIMNASLSGFLKEDGSYSKGINAFIMIDESTNWLPSDYTNLWILVSGQIKTDGNIYIKASIINEYVKTKGNMVADKPNHDTGRNKETNTVMQMQISEDEWQAVSDDLLDEIPFE